MFLFADLGDEYGSKLSDVFPRSYLQEPKLWACKLRQGLQFHNFITYRSAKVVNSINYSNQLPVSKPWRFKSSLGRQNQNQLTKPRNTWFAPYLWYYHSLNKTFYYYALKSSFFISNLGRDKFTINRIYRCTIFAMQILLFYSHQ